MTTRVVNLRHAPYDVYIGRAGKGFDGYFGNPIRPGRCFLCGGTHSFGGRTLDCYRRWFHQRLEQDAEFRRRVEELRGKILGCFCKPKPCHGDIIVSYLERPR